MTHSCSSNLNIINSYNGLSPGRRHAIIWTNAGILLICHWGTSFNEMLLEIHAFSFNKMHLNMSSAKWRPFSLGLSELKKKQCWYLWMANRNKCSNLLSQTPELTLSYCSVDVIATAYVLELCFVSTNIDMVFHWFNMTNQYVHFLQVLSHRWLLHNNSFQLSCWYRHSVNNCWRSLWCNNVEFS